MEFRIEPPRHQEHQRREDSVQWPVIGRRNSGIRSNKRIPKATRSRTAQPQYVWPLPLSLTGEGRGKGFRRRAGKTERPRFGCDGEHPHNNRMHALSVSSLLRTLLRVPPYPNLRIYNPALRASCVFAAPARPGPEVRIRGSWFGSKTNVEVITSPCHIRHSTLFAARSSSFMYHHIRSSTWRFISVFRTPNSDFPIRTR